MRAICLANAILTTGLTLTGGALSAQSLTEKASPQIVYTVNCPEAPIKIYDLYLGSKTFGLTYSSPEAASAIIAKALDDIARPAPDVANLLWERTLGTLAKLQTLASQAGSMTSDTQPRHGVRPKDADSQCGVAVVYEGNTPTRGQSFPFGSLTKAWFDLDSLGRAALALHLTLGGLYTKPDDEAVSRMTATLLSNGPDHAAKFLELLKDLPPR